MKRRAVIFDLDDTLVASSGLWRKVEVAQVESVGGKWSPELARQYNGMNAYDVAAVIHRIFLPAISLKEFQENFRAQLFRIYEHEPVATMPGAVECVRRFASRMPLAVASGSPLPLIEIALTRAGLREYFATLVSSESVPKGKPNPDVFLAAAAKLEVDPAACLVFEDSFLGLQAARAAGMDCVLTPSIHVKEMDSLALRIFSSLDEVTDGVVEQLLG